MRKLVWYENIYLRIYTLSKVTFQDARYTFGVYSRISPIDLKYTCRALIGPPPNRRMKLVAVVNLKYDRKTPKPWIKKISMLKTWLLKAQNTVVRFPVRLRKREHRR